MSTTTYRAWWTLCTLPEGAWDHKKSNSDKPLRYKRERRVEDIEAKDEEEVRIKLHWQNLSHHDRLRVKNGLGEIVPARQTYADIFAVCPARDGVRCKEVDGSWLAETQELFTAKELEAMGGSR